MTDTDSKTDLPARHIPWMPLILCGAALLIIIFAIAFDIRFASFFDEPAKVGNSASSPADPIS